MMNPIMKNESQILQLINNQLVALTQQTSALERAEALGIIRGLAMMLPEGDPGPLGPMMAPLGPGEPIPEAFRQFLKKYRLSWPKASGK